VHHGNVRTDGLTYLFNSRPVAAIKRPDEFQKAEERAVKFLFTAYRLIRARAVHHTAQDHSGETGEARGIEPDDQISARQAQIEGSARVVAFANPCICCNRFADPKAELLGVRLDPAWFPEQRIEVNHRQVQALPKGAGEGGFAATGVAQNHNPLHGDFLSKKAGHCVGSEAVNQR
jgi:hypothetical protein